MLLWAPRPELAEPLVVVLAGVEYRLQFRVPERAFQPDRTVARREQRRALDDAGHVELVQVLAVVPQFAEPSEPMAAHDFMRVRRRYMLVSTEPALRARRNAVKGAYWRRGVYIPPVLAAQHVVEGEFAVRRHDFASSDHG